MTGKDSEKPQGPPPSGPLPKNEKLPAALQKIVDKADQETNLYDELYDGTYV
jgi:fission process protein 1